jgi:Tfp pilus assembly protein PilF
MANGHLFQAEVHLTNGLKLSPNDYAGLVMVAKCQMAQKHYTEAERQLAKAITIYPAEGQSQHLAGICKLRLKQPEQALSYFETYERQLPGNPQTLFFKGMAHEHMQNRRGAAEHYVRYIQAGAKDQNAQSMHTGGYSNGAW